MTEWTEESWTMLGGIMEGRNIETPFENALNNALGDIIRADRDKACQLWSAFANVDWVHTSGARIGYSFRAAGDMIAAIRNTGTDYKENYVDYYCCGPYATVADWIRDIMAELGYTPEIL